MEQLEETFDFLEMGSWTLDNGDSESIDKEELHDYLVRLYQDRNKDYWCGSGVIVGPYLITVAHVMMDKDTKKLLPRLFYYYDDYHEITDENLVYDGRIGLYDDVDNIHHDLLVFKLPTISSSPFLLNKDDFKFPLEVCAKTDGGKSGYSFEKNKVIAKGGIHNHEIQPGKYELVKWDNCLLTTGNFTPGNSGTPIYRQETIYGLLIGNTYPPDNPCKILYNFIDARYISKMIAEVEKKS